MSALAYDIGDIAAVNLQIIDPATGAPPTAIQEAALTVTATATDPNGVLSAPATAHVAPDGSGRWTVSFTVGVAGVWRGEFAWAGSLGGREPFALVVAAAGALLPWSPSPTEVADYVPGRTRQTIPAGTDTLVGTFTTATTPTGEQVARLIAGAVAYVAGRVGTVDAGLYSLALATAAQRAAAYVELAYPERDANLNTAEQLLALSDATLTSLAAANQATTGAAVGSTALPMWAFPDPVAYGDLVL